MKSKYNIPFAPVERIIKEFTTLRVSAEAVEIITEELIRRAKRISERASDIAKMSGRMTLKDKDIKLAYDQYKQF